MYVLSPVLEHMPVGFFHRTYTHTWLHQQHNLKVTPLEKDLIGQNLKKLVQVGVSHCHSIRDWYLHIYLAVSFYTKVSLCNI